MFSDGFMAMPFVETTLVPYSAAQVHVVHSTRVATAWSSGEGFQPSSAQF